MATKMANGGVLQRKVRAYGNFTEYVPLGLLFEITLELMQSPTWFVYIIGAGTCVYYGITGLP